MDTHKTVREFYGDIAKTDGSCCAPGCCAGPPADASLKIGYTDEQLAQIPAEANLGLGCGNPLAEARLHPGETVLDLGSGAGIDAFLAAQAVGDNGLVIGVDMTHEMLARARSAAGDAWPNVQFRLGEIEHLPVADNQVDVVMSNCVINLSPAKEQVYREVFRVLKPNGRVCVSDVLALQPLPEALRNDLTALAACIGGAATVAETVAMLEAAGFTDIEVDIDSEVAPVVDEWLEGAGEFVAPAKVRARKPEA